MDFKIEPLQNPNIDSTPAPDQSRIFSGPRTSVENPNVDFAIPKNDNNDKNNRMKYVIGGLVVIVAAVIGFWFLGNGSFSQANVEFKIDGPKEIAAGELASYRISYHNKNKVQLTGVKLTFFYPESAVAVKDNDVAEANNTVVDLGDINPGVKSEVEFKAYLVGDKGNVKIPRATLVFSVDSISSQFQKDADFSTTISSLSVPLTLVAPPTTQGGQGITYIFDYRNESLEDKVNLRVKLQYPDGFEFDNASPTPNSGNNTWDISLLRAGNGERISVTGTLLGNQGETKKITAILQRLVATPSGDKYVDYEKTDAMSVISSPPLSVKLLLNNSQDYVAHLADRLEYVAEVKNNSNYYLLALNLSAKLSGTMYDFATVQSTGFFDSRTGTIAWNSSTVPEFSNLKPGQMVKIPFTVQLKKSFSGGFGTKDAFVKTGVHLETNSVPAELSQDKLTADSEIVTRISTAPAFDQKITISDPALGSGWPLPPKVDQKTTMYVRWTLINPANDVTAAKATAVLAPGVVWENKTFVSGSQPKPTYNSNTNTVTWNLGTLPAGIGLAFPKYEAVFAISMTPSVNQVGQSPTLLNNVNFSGTDSFTKEKILLNIRSMTTFDITGSDAAKTVQN